MKHTSGPWRVVNGNQIRSGNATIARVWMMRDGEGSANARLIAAAPEMHELLCDFVEKLGMYDGINPQSAVELARELLATIDC